MNHLRQVWQQFDQIATDFLIDDSAPAIAILLLALGLVLCLLAFVVLQPNAADLLFITPIRHAVEQLYRLLAPGC